MIFSKKSKTRVSADIDAFPSGTFVVTPSGRYFIQEGARLRVLSDAVVQSWSFPAKINTEEANLKGYPIVGVLGYRGGTVIYSLVDGLYYFIEKNKKRQIVNQRWFDYLGINMLDVPVASAEEVKRHKTGEVLN